MRLWEKFFDKFEAQEEYIVKIVSLKEDIEYADRYIAEILTGNNKNLRVYIYVYEKNNYNYGDILKVKGETKKPAESRNTGDFNYSRYLKTKKIVALVVAKKVQYIKAENSIIAYIYKLKQKCADCLDENFKNDEKAILKAILLGEKNNISDDISEVFSKSGLNHVLAISGFHVSYLVSYMEKLLNKITKKRKLKYQILIIFLIMYMIFTGSSPSSVRACIMTIMYYVSKILLKERDFYVSFFLSLFIVLLVNPFNIYSMSMWFSFLGSLGIYLFENAIHKVIKKIFKIKHNRISGFMFETIFVSISAQILIFPIMWKTFGTISFGFWISNVLTAQIIAPILVIGYMSLIIFPIRSFLVFIENILLKVFMDMALISSKIPFNRFFIRMPSNFIVITYYVLIFAFVIFYKKRKFTVLKIILNLNYLKKLLLKKVKIIKIIIVFLAVVLISHEILNFFPKDLRINFLAVGQGDCTLIRTKYNKVILVDSGEGHSEKYDYGQKAVLPYLLRNGISKINFLIISHFDSDHCGGAFYLLENLRVDNVVIGIQAEKYENCVQFIELAKQKKVNIITLKSDDILNLDKETRMQVLFPNIENTISDNKINNNSLVFKLVYKDFSMLFTGDVEKIGEEAILKIYKDCPEKLRATVLKVGHHGSKTSSSSNFLKAVNPRISLIGVGENNTFGHPNQEVLERLEEMRN